MAFFVVVDTNCQNKMIITIITILVLLLMLIQFQLFCHVLLFNSVTDTVILILLSCAPLYVDKMGQACCPEPDSIRLVIAMCMGHSTSSSHWQSQQPFSPQGKDL